jgi:quinolinate synthase
MTTEEAFNELLELVRVIQQKYPNPEFLQLKKTTCHCRNCRRYDLKNSADENMSTEGSVR